MRLLISVAVATGALREDPPIKSMRRSNRFFVPVSVPWSLVVFVPVSPGEEESYPGRNG
jgi:hypothetical protein